MYTLSSAYSIGREKLTKKRKPSWKSNKQVSLTKPAAPFWRAVESVEARRKKRRIDFFENVLGVAVNIKRPRTDQREREADVADGLLIRKNVVRWELVKVIHSKYLHYSSKIFNMEICGDFMHTLAHPSTFRSETSSDDENASGSEADTELEESVEDEEEPPNKSGH